MASGPPPPPPQPKFEVANEGKTLKADLSSVMESLKPTVTEVRHFTNVVGRAVGEEEDSTDVDDDDCPQSSNHELLWRAQWISTRNTFQCSSSLSSSSSKQEDLRVAVLLIDGKKQQHPKFERFAYILCGEKFAESETDTKVPFFLQQIDCEDLTTKLTRENFDVLVIPGGSIFEVQEKIDKAGGAKHILQFVRDGGGYFGVCAGGFLATRRGYSKCKEKYALINSNTSWVPGVGSARVTLSSSPLALSVLGKNLAGKDVSLHFANGSTMGSAVRNPKYIEKTQPGEITPLATYTEVKTNKDHQKFDLETSSYPYGGACGHYGKGRVVGFGPHPEASNRFGHLIVRNSILWCGKREKDSY